MKHVGLRSIAGLGLLFCFVLPCVAQQGGLGRPEENETKFIWEAPCHIVLALEKVMVRGMIPVTVDRQGFEQELRMVDLDNGETLWSVTLGSEVQSVNAYKNVLIVAVREAIAGVAIDTGDLLWQVPLERGLQLGWSQTPFWQQMSWFAEKAIESQGIGGGLLVHKDMLFCCVGGIAYGLNPETGEVVWSREAGFSLSSPIVGLDDVVLVSTSDGFAAMAVADGTVLWGAGVRHVGQVRVVEGEVYGELERQLTRFDPETGEAMWQSPYNPKAAHHFHAAGDNMAVVAEDPSLVFDRNTGEIKWQGTDRGCFSATDGTNLWVTDQGRDTITCVSIADAKEVWQVTSDEDVKRVAFAGGRVIGLCSPEAVAYSAETGQPLWQFDARRFGGLGIEELHWTNDGQYLYLKIGDWVSAVDLATGVPVMEVPGKFFFVNWMQQFNGRLYLHNGGPGGGSIGAIACPTPDILPGTAPGGA